MYYIWTLCPRRQFVSFKKKRVHKHRRELGLGLQEPTGDGPVKPTCKSVTIYFW